MGEFKRKPGEVLGLNLDLRPEPDSPRYVRAFFYDIDGAALIPSFLDLVDLGGGRHVDSTATMQSVSQMRVNYRVYLDAARTEEDECEYLGAQDVFDLDQLVPSQLPSDVKLTAEISDGSLSAEFGDNSAVGDLDSESLEAFAFDPKSLDSSESSTSVEADSDSSSLKADID